MRIFIFGILMISISTITSAQAISDPARPYGGTLVWGTHTQPTIINPILTTHSVSASLLDLIFNRLVRLNAKGEVGPDLAQRWDVSSDGLLYTFYLRQGVRFHDGVECTADDVEFTYHKIIDPEVDSPYRSSFAIVEEFKAIDTYTFQIKLREPSVTFIYRLVKEIAPKHLLENVDLKDCSFNFHPIGTGPFKFKTWTKDNQIILAYNQDYFEGRPYLDEIIIKAYPTTQDVWISLMRSEIDLAIFIEREDYEIARNDPALKTYAIPMDLYYAIFYNPEDPLLSDIRIRKAIAYAIDRKALIAKVAGGYGLECNGPFYPDSLGFYPQVKPFTYNPKESLALLAEAGWQQKNDEGILEKEGEALEITMLVDERHDTMKKIAMFIRQQLQEIGIKLRVQLYDNDSMLTDDFLKQNRIQAHLKIFSGGLDPGEGKYHWSYKTAKKEDKLWVYRNREVTRLFEAGELTPDNKKRQAIYRKIHQLIYEDQPACFLHYFYYFFAVSAKFENTDAYFSMNMPTYTIKDWYIVQKNKKIAQKIQN